MFLFSCAYAYAYVACVMLIAQVGTRLYGASRIRVEIVLPYPLKWNDSIA